jgi:hypothetical protein
MKRVLAATSVKEDEAKRDICHAVADKKIAVQVRSKTACFTVADLQRYRCPFRC